MIAALIVLWCVFVFLFWVVYDNPLAPHTMGTSTICTIVFGFVSLSLTLVGVILFKLIGFLSA